MENRNRRSKVENENVKVGVENKNEKKGLTFSFIRSSGAGFEVLDYSNCRFDDFGNPHEEIPPGLLKRAVFSCRNNKLLVFFWALNLYFSGID